MNGLEIIYWISTDKSTMKAIIFDWGRTLFDSETKKEFSEAEAVLSVLKDKGYKLGLVSLVTVHANATLEERKKQIDNSPLKKFFELIRVTDGSKDDILDEIVTKFGYPNEEVAIVDDRMIRGIRYGNLHGHPTVWFKNGKFSNELPDKNTGIPTFTVNSLVEILELPIFQ
jgi:FMN phosphatase YigB (HAD superfamily)